METKLPNGYGWKKVSFIVPGDLVHRWGDELEVVDTHHERLKIVLDVKDGGVVKSWDYKLDDQVLVKIRP